MKSFLLSAHALLLMALLLAGPAGWAAEQPAGDPKAVATVEVPKDVAGFQALQEKIKAAVAKVQPCVVGVQVGAGAGSGVIVSEDGLVMTAGHVVRKSGQPATFLFADGKTAKGTTLGAYTTSDAGLAKIGDAGKWPFAERSRSGGLKPGSWCIALGHPLGFQRERPPVVRVGRVLRVSDETIQSDCPIISGDSGGPLLDLDGRIIGIHSRIGDSMEQNLHVAIDSFNTHWDRMVKGEVWQMALPGRNGPEVKLPLRQVVGKAAQCTVRIKCDGQETALGTIVGPDGWVLTKASELKGKVLCRLRDGRELEARTVGIHTKCDLAMLKIEAAGLPLIEWDASPAGVGQWLITAGLSDEPLATGIVGAPRRPIPPASGTLGVRLVEKDGEARVEQVFPQSPAEKAGLRASDVITHVDGQPARTSADVRNLLRRYRPGVIARLTVRRGVETLQVAAQLAKFVPPQLLNRERLNMAGMGVSKRSDDFPTVVQHDAAIRPADCGGPVVDLGGKVVGVNIAHAGRTETYCLPSDVVLATMYDLMSGRLAPALVEAAAKAAAEKEAAERKAQAEKAAAEKAAADKAAADKKAAEAKAAAEKVAAEKKAAEAKAAAEKAAAEKKAAEAKAAAEKAAAEAKAAADKAAAEKAAAQKKEEQGKPEAPKESPPEKKPEEKKPG